jgi:hypothetical protein
MDPKEKDQSARQMAEMRRMLAQVGEGGLLGLGISLPGGDDDRRESAYIDELFEVSEEQRLPEGFVVRDAESDPNAGRTATFENHYGGAPVQRYATEQERYNANNPPGGDYDRWHWVPTLGWQYRGSESDGTRGKSSYFTDSGERAHYDSPQQMYRDPRWWDPKRATIGLREVWEGGGDVLAEYRYDDENPYVYTPEMQRQAETAYTPANYGVYDPTTDTTMFGGMAYQGNQTVGKTQADYSPEDWQYLEHDRYYTGHSQFRPEGSTALSEALGGRAAGNPFVNTYEQDVDRQLQYLGDSAWNPFYGYHGRIHQDVIDGQRASGVLGEELTAYEKRSDNNAMDYLYNALSSRDQVGNRRAVRDRWDKYLGDMNLSADNFYNAKMTKNLFNRLGLSDFGLEFDSSFGGDSGMMGGTGFKLPEQYQSGSSSQGIEQNRGGFMKSYMEERNKIKPSVMSLFDEMENFE